MLPVVVVRVLTNTHIAGRLVETIGFLSSSKNTRQETGILIGSLFRSVDFTPISGPEGYAPAPLLKRQVFGPDMKVRLI